MERDPRAYLWDAKQAADAIRTFIEGVDFITYDQSEMMRSAVERKFEIIGEALAQLARQTPEVAARLPDFRGPIAFRNTLIHGYHRVDHAEVWYITHTALPDLHAAMSALLEELGPPE